MAQEPLISVVVPCYNQAEYMDECLQSVLDQTYTNWECIIVNDGSPDHTEEIALKWTQKDPRFKYLKKENGGLSSARNAGIEVAKGEWIQFLDCDDKLDKNKFVDSSIFFDEYDVILTNYQLFSEKNILSDYCNFIEEKITYQSILLNWDLKFSIPIHCGLFSKSIISGFNENLKAKEDWLFWLQTLKNTEKVYVINNRQAYYRVHSKSMTKDKILMIQNEMEVYLIIYNSLNDRLKEDFFISRLKYKNESNINLDAIIKKQNLELVKIQCKLNSKRYILLDKILLFFNL